MVVDQANQSRCRLSSEMELVVGPCFIELQEPMLVQALDTAAPCQSSLQSRAVSERGRSYRRHPPPDRPPELLSVFRRRHAGHLAEQPCEMALRREPEVEGDAGD